MLFDRSPSHLFMSLIVGNAIRAPHPGPPPRVTRRIVLLQSRRQGCRDCLSDLPTGICIVTIRNEMKQMLQTNPTFTIDCRRGRLCRQGAIRSAQSHLVSMRSSEEGRHRVSPLLDL